MPDTPHPDPASEAHPDGGDHTPPDQGPDLFADDAETAPLAATAATESDPGASPGQPVPATAALGESASTGAASGGPASTGAAFYESAPAGPDPVPGSAPVAGYPATPGYPPYPPRAGRGGRRWRRAWLVPAVVGLLVGGALGAGIATAVEHHGQGDVRPHFRQFGPGPGYGQRNGPYRFAPRPGAPGRPGFQQGPGTPQTPAPGPTQSG